MGSTTNNHQLLDQYENPYFLHSSEHVGLVLATDQLNSGAEFHSWHHSVRLALNVHNKLDFIDGTVPKPLLIIVILVLGLVVATWLQLS
ncbi:hypothetical protein Bca101_059803 [Brassica carinata]